MGEGNPLPGQLFNDSVNQARPDCAATLAEILADPVNRSGFIRSIRLGGKDVCGHAPVLARAFLDNAAAIFERSRLKPLSLELQLVEAQLRALGFPDIAPPMASQADIDRELDLDLEYARGVLAAIPAASITPAAPAGVQMSVVFDPLGSLSSFTGSFTNPVLTTSFNPVGNSFLGLPSAVTDPTFLTGLAQIAAQFLAAQQAGNQAEDLLKLQLQLATAQQGGGIAGANMLAAPAAVMEILKQIGVATGSAAVGALGGSIITNLAGTPATPATAVGRAKLPQVIQVMGVDYVKRGRPLLYSSDFASAKRVRKVASKARSRAGVRRRVTSGLTFCNGCTQPISSCKCK